MKLDFYAIRALREAIRQLLPDDWEPSEEEPQITAAQDGPDAGRLAVVFGIRRRKEIDLTFLERRRRG